MTPRKLVTTIAAVLVACSAAVISVYMARRGFEKAGPQTIRFILTCLMSYWLVRGSSAARWIAIVLMGFAGVMSLFAGLALISRSPGAIGVLSLGAIYIACAVGLLSPVAKAHFTKPETVEQNPAGDVLKSAPEE